MQQYGDLFVPLIHQLPNIGNFTLAGMTLRL